MRTQLLTITALSVVAGAGAAGGAFLASGHDTVAPVAPSGTVVSSPTVGVSGGGTPAPPQVSPVGDSAAPTRTVTVVQGASAAPASTPKPVKPRGAEPVSEQPAAPPAPVADDPDPGPASTPAPNYDQPQGPWQHGGMPSSMNGTPDPKIEPDPDRTAPPVGPP